MLEKREEKKGNFLFEGKSLFVRGGKIFLLLFSVFLFFSVFLLSSILLSCGRKFEDVKSEEEQFAGMTAEEKINLGKSYLEAGLISDARKLFKEAIDAINEEKALAKCEKGKGPESNWLTCPYCDALYGTFVAEFLGLVGLLKQLISLAGGSEVSGSPEGSGSQVAVFRQSGHYVDVSHGDVFHEHESPRLKETEKNNPDILVSKTIEGVIGLLLNRINDTRVLLGKIISTNCMFQSKATATLALLENAITIPGQPTEDGKFIYSPIFASMNYSVLSLLAGLLDILYSQNYSLSVSETFSFIRELIKEAQGRKEGMEGLMEVVALTGDFFAKNPSLFTLNDERKKLWQEASKDMGEGLTSLANTLTEIVKYCEGGGSNREATVATLESIVNTLLESAKLPLSISICPPDALSEPLLQEFPELLSKWGEGLEGKRKCGLPEGEKKISLYPGEELQDRLQEDGCIRFAEDITAIITFTRSLENLPSFSPIFKTRIAIRPEKFFEPKSLRTLLPLVVREGDRYLFAFESETGDESETEDTEHFAGTYYSLEGGFPSELTYSIKIPSDCVPSSPLYIAWADPTFGGSLFISTYKLSFGTPCFAQEINMGIADKEYMVSATGSAGIYAINKSLGGIFSLLFR